MNEEMGRLKKLLIGSIAILLFFVFLFTYFTFSEDSKTKNYKNIQQVLKNDNIDNIYSSSHSKFSFEIIKRKIEISSETSSNDSNDSSVNIEGDSSSVNRVSSSSVISSVLSNDNYSSFDSSPQSSQLQDDNISIIGGNVLTSSQLYSFAKTKEKDMRLTCSLKQLIDLYLSIGSEYGVRGDIAFLQAVIETGWFKYNRPNSYKIKNSDGTTTVVYEPRPEGLYVVPNDNNFCGLGVTGYIGSEKSVCRFSTAALGVEAQIQHLFAYACKDSIPTGKTLIDPRFKYVSRGSASTWNELGNGKWAADISYSTKILNLYNKALSGKEA